MAVFKREPLQLVFINVQAPHARGSQILVEDRNATPYQPTTVWLITGLIIIVLGLATGAILYLSYVDTRRQQKNKLLNIATALSAQTATVAQAMNRNLRQVSRMYLARADRKSPFVFSAQEKGAPDPLLIDVVLYDLRGQAVGSCGPARVHARAPAGPVPGGAGLSMTDIDPKTGASPIRIERPLLDDDGNLIATIVGRVASTRLAQLYSPITLGCGGSVTLFRRDGVTLIRGPPFPALSRPDRALVWRHALVQEGVAGGRARCVRGHQPPRWPAQIVWLRGGQGFSAVDRHRDEPGCRDADLVRAPLDIGHFLFAGRAGPGRFCLAHQPKFWRGFEHAIERAGAGEYSVAIIVLQLERLHEIIDLLGPGTGNRALATVGVIVAGHHRPGVMLARVRGSEFGFLVELHERGIDLAAYATTLSEALSHPVALEGRDFYLAPFLVLRCTHRMAPVPTSCTVAPRAPPIRAPAARTMPFSVIPAMCRST